MGGDGIGKELAGMPQKLEAFICNDYRIRNLTNGDIIAYTYLKKSLVNLLKKS